MDRPRLGVRGGSAMSDFVDLGGGRVERWVGLLYQEPLITAALSEAGYPPQRVSGNMDVWDVPPPLPVLKQALSVLGLPEYPGHWSEENYDALAHTWFPGADCCPLAVARTRPTAVEL